MKKKIIDLFCGCGGLSLGFEQAGFEVAYAIDMWDKAIMTYNHRDDILEMLDKIQQTIYFQCLTIMMKNPDCNYGIDFFDVLRFVDMYGHIDLNEYIDYIILTLFKNFCNSFLCIAIILCNNLRYIFYDHNTRLCQVNKFHKFKK